MDCCLPTLKISGLYLRRFPSRKPFASILDTTSSTTAFEGEHTNILTLKLHDCDCTAVSRGSKEENISSSVQAPPSNPETAAVPAEAHSLDPKPLPEHRKGDDSVDWALARFPSQYKL